MIHYNCVGIFIPDVFLLPAPQALVNTGKGVAVNFVPARLTVWKKRVFLQSFKCCKNTRYGCGGRTRTYDLRVMSSKRCVYYRFAMCKNVLQIHTFLNYAFYIVMWYCWTFCDVVEFLLNSKDIHKRARNRVAAIPGLCLFAPAESGYVEHSQTLKWHSPARFNNRGNQGFAAFFFCHTHCEYLHYFLLPSFRAASASLCLV